MPIYDDVFGRPDGPGVEGDFRSCGGSRGETGTHVHAMPEDGADSGSLWVFNPYTMASAEAVALLEEDDRAGLEWTAESSWLEDSAPGLSLGVLVSYRDGEPVLYCGH